MEQPTPTYRENDLERVIVRDYDSRESLEAKSILVQLGAAWNSDGALGEATG
jgi:hypothetical protein